MTMLDHYVRAGDMRPRGAFSYVSDFDAWPEKSPAAAPALRDRAGAGPNAARRDARPEAPFSNQPFSNRERAFA